MADQASRSDNVGEADVPMQQTGPLRMAFRIASWALLAALLILAFRGYLSPTFLLDFANNWLC